MSEDWQSPRRNANRGYRRLTVWQDAIEYYALTCRIFRSLPYVLRRVASDQIASADSVHRNIAEGYSRRSASEYLRYLNIAISSAVTLQPSGTLAGCQRQRVRTGPQPHRLCELRLQPQRGVL